MISWNSGFVLDHQAQAPFRSLIQNQENSLDLSISNLVLIYMVKFMVISVIILLITGVSMCINEILIGRSDVNHQFSLNFSISLGGLYHV